MKHTSRKKERDKSIVMAVARRFGPLSRVDIHELTSLRPTSISLLVRELLDEGRLLESGLSDNPTGRKQILLHLNEEEGSVVGLEYGSESIITATTNLRPRVKTITKESSYLEGGREGLIKQLVSCARQAVQAQKGRSLVGIGIADPGIVDSDRGISLSSSTLDFWKNVPLKAIFEKEFGVAFLLENGTRARTVAERALGDGESSRDMIYMEYGAGIGLGIIAQGRVLRGHRGGAGEFGHINIIENGPACKCGGFGCLEAVAAAPALASRARNAIAEGSNSQVMELARGNPKNITGWMVLEAAKSGDKLCATVVEDIVKYLGIGIANAVNLLNPGQIVLDQRLESAGQELLDGVMRAVRRFALPHLTENLSFRFSNLDDEAAVLGVSSLILDREFEIPSLKPPKFLIEMPPAKLMRKSAVGETPTALAG